MGHLLGAIDQAKLDEQRGVVQNEKRQGENEPYGKVVGLPHAQALSRRTTRTPGRVIGSMEDLERRHARRREGAGSRPTTARRTPSLVLAGDVDAEDRQGEGGEVLRRHPSGPAGRAPRGVGRQAHREPARQSMQDRVPQARLYKVWNVPGWGTADADYLDLVASTCLSSGKSSRLYKRLVLRRADRDRRRRARSSCARSAACSSSRPRRSPAVTSPRSSRRSTRSWPASWPTARRGRAGARQDAVPARASSAASSASAASAASPTCWPGRGLRRPARLYKTQLQRVARRDRRAGPRRGQALALRRRLHARGSAVPRVRDGRDRRRPHRSCRSPARRRGRVPRARARHALQRAQDRARRSGTSIPSRAASTCCSTPATPPTSSPSPGTAQLTMACWTRAPRRAPRSQISDELAALGADLEHRLAARRVERVAEALQDELDPSLDALRRRDPAPGVPAERLRAAPEAAARADPAGEGRARRHGAARVPAAALRRGPRLRQPAGPAPAPRSRSAKISRDDLVKFHRTWFKPNHATLIVVGAHHDGRDPAEAGAALRRLEAGRRPDEEHRAPSPPQPHPTVYLLDRPGAIQSVLLAGNVAPPKANPDEPAIETMNAVLGGDFISRINMNLREDKHWSYGAFSFIRDARGQRPFIAYAPVQTDKTKEAIVELQKELRGILGDRPVDGRRAGAGEGLAHADAAGVLGDHGRRRGQSSANIVTFGLDDRYFDTYADRVRAQTASDGHGRRARRSSSPTSWSGSSWATGPDRARAPGAEPGRDPPDRRRRQAARRREGSRASRVLFRPPSPSAGSRCPSGVAPRSWRCCLLLAPPGGAQRRGGGALPWPDPGRPARRARLREPRLERRRPDRASDGQAISSSGRAATCSSRGTATRAGRLNGDAAIRFGQGGGFYAGAASPSPSGWRRHANRLQSVLRASAPRRPDSRLKPFIEFRWTFVNDTSPFRLVFGFTTGLWRETAHHEETVAVTTSTSSAVWEGGLRTARASSTPAPAPSG